jgi:hypothetical protein
MTIDVRPAPVFVHPPYVAGRYYSGMAASGVLTGATITNGLIYYAPFILPVAAKFDRICWRYTTASGSAGSLGRCAIYSDANATPGGLIIDAGTFATDTAATATPEITISALSLGAGLYWIALQEDTNSGAVAWSPQTFSCNIQGGNSVAGGFASSGGQTGRTETFTFGALPSTATPVGFVSSVPNPVLRAA